MTPLSKLVARYLIDSARDGWVNAPWNDLIVVSGLNDAELREQLTQLTRYGIITPTDDKGRPLHQPLGHDWPRGQAVICHIKPSGLMRLMPMDQQNSKNSPA